MPLTSRTMTPAHPVPVVMCFDIEPDERTHIPAPGTNVEWHGTPAMIELVDGWRDRLSEATGAPAHFGWYLRLDPAIKSLHGDPGWAADTFAPQLDRLVAQGDALGIHTHGLRWEEEQAQWNVDLGSHDWLRESVESSLAVFLERRGERCRLNRMGDWFMTNELMSVLEVAGVEIDMTVEPSQKPRPTNNPEALHTGSLPDYRFTRRVPYRPSRSDFRRPANGDGDARALWELPLVAVDIRPITPLRRRAGRFMRYPFRPPHRPWPLWAPYPGKLFWHLIERDVMTLDRPCVVFATRTDSAIRKDDAELINDKMAALIDSPVARRVRFATPHEALDLLHLTE